MVKNKWLRTVSLCLAGLLAFSAMPLRSVRAEEQAVPSAGQEAVLNTASSYAAYEEKNAALAPADASVTVSAASFSAEKDSGARIVAELYGKSNVLQWDSEKGSVSFPVTVAADGWYTLRFVYAPLPGNGSDIRLGLKVDGAYPYEELQEFSLPRMWKNAGEARTDGQGNEFAPEQVEIGETFFEREVYDTTGKSVLPYELALTAGEHTIELVSVAQPFALSAIVLAPPEQTAAYQKPASTEDYYTGPDLLIEGENGSIKSARSLGAKSDSSNASLSPVDAAVTKLNYIGSSTWNVPGQTITWKVQVEKSGYYKLGFRYRQSANMNKSSYRWLRIDGKTPFAEARTIAFPYKSKWDFLEYSDGTEPYLIYLEEGEREISLSVTLGEMGDIYRRLESVVEGIGDLYLKMAVITGENPDPNRDYDLFRLIPNFNERLLAYSQELREISKLMKSVDGAANASTASFDNLVRVMETMVDRPYTAQQYKQDFYDGYTTISSGLRDMGNMPLDIDQICFSAAEGPFEKTMCGFFESMLFGVKRFFSSFLMDYDTLSDAESQGGIKLWVNWGRDQAQVLDALIRESFTPQTGISVNLEIVNATLTQGLLSQNQPDCLLMMSRSEPVNLAMRGALYDLTSFPDYEEVIQRFQEGATRPYQYRDGTYALPDSQTYYMMFYRTDVLADLGLSVPGTWDEFEEVMSVIQRNNMEVGLPYTRIADSTTVNVGLGGLSLFATLLLQNDVSLYNATLTEADLSSYDAIQVATRWTDYYTKKMAPVESDFYTRFRIGIMPLGIQPYSMYSTLTAAAPEIKDRWAMAPIPGVLQADGTINNKEAGAGTGCAVVKKSKKHAEAWAFLKWWTSAETQLDYSTQLESILGVAGRHATSNVAALSQYAWDTDDIQVLLEQWEKVEELPEIPGGYYIPRVVDQIFWSVINDQSSVAHAMMKWNDVVNNEIARKYREYEDS